MKRMAKGKATTYSLLLPVEQVTTCLELFFEFDPINETVQRRFGDRVLSLHGPTIRLLELLGALARVSVGGSRNFRHGVRSSSDICRF